MATLRWVPILMMLATLTGCVGAAWYQTYANGRIGGCDTGRYDAQWPGFYPSPIPAEASAEFRRGWHEAYRECFAFADANPRTWPGPGGGAGGL